MAGNGLTDKQRLWFDHVESCGKSGISMRAYSAQHGLDLQHFYSWKKQLKALGVLSKNGSSAGQSKRARNRPQVCALDQPSAPFVRAATVSTHAQSLTESSERQRPCGARIILANGITIEVPAGIAPNALARLIVAAQQVATGKDGSRS